MTKVNFAASREKAEKEGLLGGSGKFKPQEGDNRIRLMSECLEHPNEFKGQKRFQWLCYVLDRRDGKIKPYFMPHTIYKAIEKLQLDTEYAFDEVPMPYDVTINAKGAGTKEVEYTVIPARANTPLTPSEKALLTGTQPITELQKAVYERQPVSESVEQPEPQEDAGPDIQMEMPA